MDRFLFEMGEGGWGGGGGLMRWDISKFALGQTKAGTITRSQIMIRGHILPLGVFVTELAQIMVLRFTLTLCVRNSTGSWTSTLVLLFQCGIRRRDFESHWNRKKRKLGQEIAHLEMMAAKERRRQSEAETLLEQEEVLHEQLQEKCSDLLMELARAVEPDIEIS